MAYALVGTIGAVSQGAASASVTPAYGQTPTAGNLLILFSSIPGSNSGMGTTPSGWTVAKTSLHATVTCECAVYYKIAAGGDAAPTCPAVSGGVIAAQLAEFSGNTATPLDQTGNINNATSSPATATFAAADAASGELIVMSCADFRSASRAPNDTWTSNNATITQAGSNNGVSTANHYSFGYSLATTSNAIADTAILTASVTTSLSGITIAAATFKPIPPSGPTAQQKAAFFMFF